MQFHYSLGLGLTLVALSSYSAATDNDYSTRYSLCMDASGGVTLHMLNCAAEEMQQQDARLNHNYQTAMRTLEPAQQSQLRDAPRLWLKFRDADCQLLGNLTGGTIDAINSARCVLDKTRQRANELDALSTAY